jgi:hypothetical protein
MATVSRTATLVISGIPTLVAWGLISRQLGASDFAGVALAISVPTVINFILPALGARMANTAAVGSDAFHEAVAGSIQANFVVGVSLVAVTGLVAAVSDWNDLLGRSDSSSFPMDTALVSVSAIVAVWVVLLVGERVLIAQGRTSARVWASGATGPFTLGITLLLISWSRVSAWMFALPVPLGMLLASVVSVVLAVRLPEFDACRTLRMAMHHVQLTGKDGSKHLTVALILTEAALALSIWVIRPMLSIHGSDQDVAAISLAFQFAAPVLSLVAVLGQSVWPYYARHRGSLSVRSISKHASAFAAMTAVLALGYVVAVGAAEQLSLIGQEIGMSVLCAMGFYVVCRGLWQPVRIAFSSDSASLGLALIVCVTSLVGIALSWVVTAWGSWQPLVILSAVLIIDAVLSTVVLTGRLVGSSECPEGVLPVRGETRRGSRV